MPYAADSASIRALYGGQQVFAAASKFLQPASGVASVAFAIV